ncbi:glycosyltransferase family 4 protein [Plesiomonas shigelloides]|uniref:glycosyltransferase family 4 protein n=1 Tax=Plesiomonas shigelloides TaxID=703 RepID=UPI00387EFA74
MLIRQHVNMGDDVLVIASTETYNSQHKLDYINPGEYIGSDGAKVIRLPYRNLYFSKLKKKVRSYPEVYKLLSDFSPDVIMFHGPCAWELLTVARYVRKNKAVRLFVDSHEDKYNSARGWFSRFLLYKCFYTPIINLSKKYFSKFFYLSYECKLFCNEVYGLKDSELEFFPLGGVVFDDFEYSERRLKKRKELNFSDSEVIFFQSGKFDKKKKLLQSIMAFKNNTSSSARLVIAGGFDSEIEGAARDLISSDSRIIYVGWTNPEELQSLLCAADVYVQPGSQSATLQMSLSARCAVIVDDVPSHRYIINNNGIFVRDDAGLCRAYKQLSDNPERVFDMSRESFQFASEMLDYNKLARRLYK